ncbi:unnamed protein product [Arctia plantaginis]|uniref:GATOR2 complex protein WDR24 n=1 Tax=Arctia plantaginis TaxID=874455 RepID=A0A8S0Z6F4_ARCPL|nr:unnamed protein product [Arctia plantaginis]
MIPSNTICVSQEGPANALALNKDCSQVVIAGRNVFKVFSIGENDFSEVCNLRVGKNLNLNFSSIDVAWSTIEENTLATAATNGAVVVWNLGRSGRSKQEHVFSDHKRTVNKVSFHLTEPALLISGSQDGMMKCFDLRMKEVARTFISNTESIRDVQFSPHQANTFAAVSENGNVQLWDVRRHERCLLQFTAHSGPVFACDWHPEMPWLATASRDKTIKVWDIYGKPNLEHTIYTIASVGHVKWRPQKKYQVASCALVLDCAVHVWDVRRPHVPLATFAEHRDVTTAIAWLAEPQSFLSTSRDCSLYRHRFSEAAHPVLWANPQSVCVSARGELAHAAPERPLPAPTMAPAAPDRHVPGLGRKHPTAGALSSAAQAQLERAFPGGASSTLCRYRAASDRPTVPNGLPQAALPQGTEPQGRALPLDSLLPHVASEPRAAPLHSALVYCALNYKIRGGSPHELAAHNAEVARSQNRHMVSHVWEIVRCEYSSRAAAGRGTPAPPPARDSLPTRPEPPPLPPYNYTYTTNAVEEEPLEEVEDWAETQFHNSGVLGKPTLSIYIPPNKQPAHVRNDDSAGWVSAASAHYVDVDAVDWTLPEEAFPLRTAPPPPAPQHHQQIHTSPVHHQHQHHDEKDPIPSHRGNGGDGMSPGGSSSPGSGSSGSACTAPPNLQAHYNNIQAEGGAGEAGAGGALAVREAACWRAPLELAPLLAAALRAHADLGDVQTAAVVMLVLQDHRSDLYPYIEESLQEHWLLGYIELLQRHKLYNVATEVVRCAWLSSVWVLSQQSTVVAVCCGRCGRRTRPHAPCDSCHPLLRHTPDLCAVCHQVPAPLLCTVRCRTAPATPATRCCATRRTCARCATRYLPPSYVQLGAARLLRLLPPAAAPHAGPVRGVPPGTCPPSYVQLGAARLLRLLPPAAAPHAGPVRGVPPVRCRTPPATPATRCCATRRTCARCATRYLPPSYVQLGAARLLRLLPPAAAPHAGPVRGVPPGTCPPSYVQLGAARLLRLLPPAAAPHAGPVRGVPPGTCPPSYVQLGAARLLRLLPPAAAPHAGPVRGVPPVRCRTPPATPATRCCATRRTCARCATRYLPPSYVQLGAARLLRLLPPAAAPHAGPVRGVPPGTCPPSYVQLGAARLLRLLPPAAAPHAGPVRGVPPDRSRSIRLVSGMFSRWSPSSHAQVDGTAPTVSSWLRAHLSAWLTSAP